MIHHLSCIITFIIKGLMIHHLSIENITYITFKKGLFSVCQLNELAS